MGTCFWLGGLVFPVHCGCVGILSPFPANALAKVDRLTTPPAMVAHQSTPHATVRREEGGREGKKGAGVDF